MTNEKYDDYTEDATDGYKFAISSNTQNCTGRQEAKDQHKTCNTRIISFFLLRIHISSMKIGSFIIIKYGKKLCILWAMSASTIRVYWYSKISFLGAKMCHLK